MDESGYIKLFRSIQENDLWYSEPFTKAQAWVDILLSANFKDGGFYVRGVWVDVKRGQCARSEITMSILWKWSRNKVRRYLDSLRKRGMVTLERNNKTTLITICNYDSFQSQKAVHDTPNDTPNDTPERHQKDTKRYTNNKEKKDKKEKNYSEDSKEFRLSLYLLNKIRERKPDLKMPNLQNWSYHSDLILRLDKRSPKEVKNVVDWCQSDEFWQDNILSTAKLRKQYDKLVLKMRKSEPQECNYNAFPGAINV